MKPYLLPLIIPISEVEVCFSGKLCMMMDGNVTFWPSAHLQIVIVPGWRVVVRVK